MSTSKSKEYYRGLADSQRWESGERGDYNTVIVDNGLVRIEDVSEDYLQGLVDSGLIAR